jgi:hypothetical protein
MSAARLPYESPRVKVPATGALAKGTTAAMWKTVHVENTAKEIAPEGSAAGSVRQDQCGRISRGKTAP